MNVLEGARRMKRAGLFLVMIPWIVLLLVWAIALIVALLHKNPAELNPFGGIFLYLAIPGGMLWLAGWIVEGFGKDLS